ncbi:MAG: hypothetical protein J0L89_07710 [Xanthomonadales bacterium]|nr:hypothetical protein [Xanthomonadales bacterium]
MSDYVKQIQSQQAYIVQIDGDLARVAGRLDSFYPERTELEADLERLDTVRSELVAMAAHSDEAYAKLRPHDRNVAELIQRKEDLDAMISRLEAERASAEAAKRERYGALRRLEELHLREVGKAAVAELAGRLRDELTNCALAHREGSSWQSWTDARLAIAETLFPSDPLRLPGNEREAILHRITDGLLGTPLAR